MKQEIITIYFVLKRSQISIWSARLPSLCPDASWYKKLLTLINYASREPGEQVVSPAAEITCVPRADNDEFLLLGTDGVWDVLSNQVQTVALAGG